MNYKSAFKEKVLAHLAAYKVSELQILKEGLNFNNNRTYKHILPEELKDKNILEPYRESFFSSKHCMHKLHQGFHHLNSSQVLCFNFFYPLIVENRLDLFLELLGLKKQEIQNVQFEFVSDLENSKGKTNFDFFLEMTDGARIYVEVKYTENKFADASINLKYLNKFKKIYQPFLNGNPFIREQYKTPEAFLKNYQIMRNLVHINSRDYLVFLYPKENSRIHVQAKLAYNEMLTDEGKNKLKLLALENALNYFEDHISETRLKKCFDEFKRKYLP